MAYNWQSLDPQQLDYLIRTVYGEAGNEPALGQQAVAAVIGNRMRQGNRSVQDVVLEPSQFEPWNRADARARMQALDPNGPQYAAIRNTILGMQTDPTGGARNFYSPTGQAAEGRAAPAWATGPYWEMGRHRFYGGSPNAQGSPLAASVASVAGPVGQSYQMPPQAAVAAPQRPQPPVSADYLARLQGYRRPGVNIAGLQPGLGGSLAAMLESAPEHIRNAVRINSGVRTNEEQARLYALYKAGKGPLAAKPGYSKHQTGNSLDLSFGVRGTPERNAVRDWVHKQAPAFGLAFPLLAKGEDWHIEAAGAPGANAKVMPAGLGGAAPQNVTDLSNAAPGASMAPAMAPMQPAQSPGDKTVSDLLAELAKDGNNISGASGSGGNMASAGGVQTSPGIAGTGMAARLGELSAQALAEQPRQTAPLGVPGSELAPQPFVVPGAQNPLAMIMAQQAAGKRRGLFG